MKKITNILLIFFGLVFFGCARVQTGINKEERLLIGTKQEVEIGKSVARNVEKEYKVLNDPEITSYVNEIGQRVAATSFRQDVKYHFKVLDDKAVNAFACPGGFIYICGGALTAMENESQLAFVLGHEIGHVAGRHSAERIQQAMGVSLLAGLFLEECAVSTRIAEVATNLVFLGYSRRDEFEADELGVHFTYKANYDPRGGIEFFEILKAMKKREPSRIETFLSTHPPTSERIERIKEQIDKLPRKEGLEVGEARHKEVVSRLAGRY